VSTSSLYDSSSLGVLVVLLTFFSTSGVGV